MTPSADQPFFVASMGAAAALLGLLFVAVSVAPERTVGAGAPVERQVVAESVFIALIDAFFTSMAGTIPDLSLGSVALALSAFGLVQTLHVAWRLWPRQVTARSLIQRMALVVVALAIYGLQFGDAFQLIHLPSATVTAGIETGILFALYAFALGRSWELLGARRGILLARLTPIFSDDRQPGASSPPASPAATSSTAPNIIENGSRKDPKNDAEQYLI